MWLDSCESPPMFWLFFSWEICFLLQGALESTWKSSGGETVLWNGDTMWAAGTTTELND